MGYRVEIFWPIDNALYKGSVSELTPDRKLFIVYDDDDVETLLISDANWRYELSAHAELGNFTTLPSDEQSVLRELIHVFGNKSFLRHQAQGFEKFPLVNAYVAEENEFTKNVKVVTRSNLPPQANIIQTHVIYKIKLNDDSSL